MLSFQNSRVFHSVHWRCTLVIMARGGLWMAICRVAGYLICLSVRTVRAQPRRYGGHRDHPPPQFLSTHSEGKHSCRYPPFYSQFKIGTVLDILGIRRSKPTAHEGYSELSIFRPGSSFLLCTITRVNVSPRCGGVPPRVGRREGPLFWPGPRTLGGGWKPHTLPPSQ